MTEDRRKKRSHHQDPGDSAPKLSTRIADKRSMQYVRCKCKLTERTFPCAKEAKIQEPIEEPVSHQKRQPCGENCIFSDKIISTNKLAVCSSLSRMKASLQPVADSRKPAMVRPPHSPKRCLHFEDRCSPSSSPKCFDVSATQSGASSRRHSGDRYKTPCNKEMCHYCWCQKNVQPASCSTSSRSSKKPVSPQDEELRVAHVDDYKAVMDIDRCVFRGLDRATCNFESYVCGEGTTGWVYKKNERVVGFVCARLVDGGQTLGTTAGRLVYDYRGKGLYAQFKQAVLAKYEGLPNLRYTVMTVDNTGNRAVTKQTLLKYTVVLEKASKIVRIDVEAFEEYLQAFAISSAFSLRELSSDELAETMNLNPSQLCHLFPEERLLLRPSWLPFRIMPENTSLLTETNNVFVASYENPADPENDSRFPGDLLSCGGYYSCLKGVSYHLDIFGKTRNSEHLRAHLTWHVQRLANEAHAGSDVYLYSVYPLDMEDCFEEVIGSFPNMPADINYNRELVLERKLHMSRRS